MSTINLQLSPQFPRFATGKPNGLNVFASANVQNRLILQDGTQGGKDEFNMDTLSVPFKIFAGSDWRNLLPSRGDAPSGFPNMVVWDPVSTFTIGKAFVEMRMLLKGLLALNGANKTYNGFKLNPPPRDSTGIASAQISGTDGTSTLDLVFYRPQTVYRYVTTTEDAAPPAVINDANRRPVVISSAIRGSNAPPDQDDDGNDAGGGAATYVGYNVGTRQRCSDLDVTRVGNFFQNTATVVFEYYDTASPS